MSTFPHALEDRFRPVRLLGQGGYGAVWLAVQKALDREVALKLLHGHALAEADLVGRFLAEARVTAALAHPNIVILVDHNVDERLPWIAYEYLPGPTLSSRISQGKLTQSEALTAALHVARALEVAHGQGVLHRDVKPDNVIADGRGGWKVTDFGIARWVSGSVKTAAGLVMGTPPFMAPEMFLGDPPTPQVDLYALGVLLFEALTGRLPYGGDNVGVMAEAHLRAPVPRVDGASPRIERLVRRALAKLPRDRPESAREMAAELEGILSGEAPTLSAGQPTRRRSGLVQTVVMAPRAPRRWPWALALAAALALVPVVAHFQKAPPPPTRIAADRVDTAVDALMQRLKALEHGRVMLDTDGARPAERVAAQLVEVAGHERELADIAAAFVPERYEPPRRAHVAFRIAACRWSTACWRHRLETHTDAFDAPGPKKIWPELVALMQGLPAALTGGEVAPTAAGDRSWLIHAASNDIAFLARHFAFAVPCKAPEGGLDHVLAAFETPAEGVAGLVRGLFRAEARLGLIPAREHLIAEVDLLGRAILGLRPHMAPHEQADLGARWFHAIEKAVDQVVGLQVGRPDTYRKAAATRLDARQIAGLEAEHRMAAAALRWSHALPPHPWPARERPLKLRATGLTWLLESAILWARRRPAPADAEPAFLKALADYAAHGGADQPFQADVLPNLLWELRLLAATRVALAGGPDARIANAIATLRALPPPDGERGRALVNLSLANLEMENDAPRVPAVPELLAQLESLRTVFAKQPDAASQRDMLMRDLCARVQLTLDPHLEHGANLKGAMEKLKGAERGQGRAAVAPFVAAEEQALALADGLVEQLSRRPGPTATNDGWFAHVAAVSFTTWLRVGRLRMFRDREDFGLLVAANPAIAAGMVPPLPWKTAAPRLHAHASAVRAVLSGSRAYSKERDEAAGWCLRDIYWMAREMSARHYALQPDMPRDMADDARRQFNAPDADPALVGLLTTAFDAVWFEPDRNRRPERCAPAMEAAKAWPLAVESLRTHLSLD